VIEPWNIVPTENVWRRGIANSKWTVSILKMISQQSVVSDTWNAKKVFAARSAAIRIASQTNKKSNRNFNLLKEVNCFANPCEVTECSVATNCVSNYCDGCNAFHFDTKR
jgi:hypothetical protein